MAFTLSYFFLMKGTWLTFHTADTLAFFLVLSFFIPQMMKFRKAAHTQAAAGSGVDTGMPIV